MARTSKISPGVPPVARDDERTVNLLFALLEAAEQQRSLTVADLRVLADYRAYATKRSQLEAIAADIKHLQIAGVPILSWTDGNGETCYQLSKADYRLPPLEFSAEEAAAIALTTSLGVAPELQNFLQSGWTKLAAGGVRLQQPALLGRYSQVSDLSSVPLNLLTRLRHAAAGNQRIEFAYGEQTRRLDVWGLVERNTHFFVVGFDLDRQTTRCFRLNRIAKVQVLGAGEHPRPNTPLTELLTAQLRELGQIVDVDFILATGVDPASIGWVSQAEQLGETGQGTHFRLCGVDRQDVINQAISLAPAVRVTGPAAVVTAIKQLLKGVIAAHDRE